jgi:hypothetical protein
MNSVYAGFFSKQIVGSTLFREYFFNALKNELEDTMGVVVGEAVVDPTGSGVGLGLTVTTDTIGERAISVTGSRRCVTDSGKMFEAGDAVPDKIYTSGSYELNCTFSDACLDVPFNNTNGVTSYVYLGTTSIPIDVHIGSNGSRGYGMWSDVVGFSVVPNAIILSGGKIILELDSALTALGMAHWTTSVSDTSRSMPVVVWLNTDVAGVKVHNDDPLTSIAFGHMVKSLATGAWKIDITTIGDGKLGQPVVSTVASNYKVAVLGPLITNSTSLQADPDWVYIGSSASSTVSDTVSTVGQPVVVPYSMYTAGFGVEHVSDPASPSLGRHKRVTAETGADLELRLDSGSGNVVRITNIGSGTASLVVEDYIQTPQIYQGADFTVDLTGSTDRVARFKNSGSAAINVVVEGTIAATATSGGTGLIEADTGYKIKGSSLFKVLYDALSIMMAGFHHSTGGGVLSYYGGGGGNVNYVYVTGSVTGVKTILVPIHPPDGFVVKEMRVHHWQASVGTPNVKVAIMQWDEGTGNPVSISGGWSQCNTRTGSWAADQIVLATMPVLTFNETRKYYLALEITNNGITNDSARVGRVILRGTMSSMPYFQQ